jgi:hypothetical protein
MTNDFENLLDAIRVELYEKTKGMSNADVAEKTNANGKRIAEKYGIALVKSDIGQSVAKQKRNSNLA